MSNGQRLSSVPNPALTLALLAGALLSSTSHASTSEVMTFATNTPGGIAPNTQSARSGPRLQWDVALPQSVFQAPVQRETAKPILIEDRLFVGSSRERALLVYDPNDGVLIDRWETKGAIESSPAYDAGTQSIYVADTLGNVYRFSLDGQVLWSVALNEAIITPLTVDSGRVFYRALSDGVGMLNAEDGEIQWSYGREAPPDTAILGGSLIEVKGSQAFAGFADGAVVALDTRTGAPIWESLISAPDSRWRDVDVVHYVDAQCLFISAYSGPAMCLIPQSGAINWTKDVAALTEPLVTETQLIFPSLGGIMQALERQTGEEVWRWEAPKPINDGPYWRQRPGRPFEWQGQIVYGTSRGYVYGLDPITGEEAWSFKPWVDAFGFFGEVTFNEDSLYLLSGGGHLYHLTANSWLEPIPNAKPRVQWHDSPTEDPSGPPAVNGQEQPAFGNFSETTKARDTYQGW